MAEYKFIEIPAGAMVDVEDYEGESPDNDMTPLVDTEPQPHRTGAPTIYTSILQAQRPFGDSNEHAPNQAATSEYCISH